MMFIGFTAGRDQASRSRKQICHWNAKAIGQSHEAVGRRVLYEIVLDPIDVTCGYGFSKAGALLGHIVTRETLLIPNSANEVPEGFWTPICHLKGLHSHFNARTH